MDKNIFITGLTGIGKSVLVESSLSEMTNVIFLKLQFSLKTQCRNIQD